MRYPIAGDVVQTLSGPHRLSYYYFQYIAQTDFTGHQGTSTPQQAAQRIAKYALIG